MSRGNPLGFGRSMPLRSGPNDATEHIIVQRPLHRVLAFTGHSIHDVVNNPMAKREVLGWYKLYRQIERSGEVSELERQWNPLGTRV